MAGLSVLLEAQKSFPKCPQVISKITLMRTKTPLSPPSPPHPFLEHCFLCRQPLADGKDIYMYRGDRAFCSVECRCRQIFMDEESGKKDNCSAAAGTAAARRRGKSRGLAGGDFAY